MSGRLRVYVYGPDGITEVTPEGTGDEEPTKHLTVVPTENIAAWATEFTKNDPVEALEVEEDDEPEPPDEPEEITWHGI